MARRILLVDEHEPVRRLLARILTPAGYDVVECRQEADALKRVAEAPDFHAILLEPSVEGTGGLIPFLRERHPELMDRLVICTTGMEEAPPRGVPVLTKPFAARDVLRVVEEAGS